MNCYNHHESNAVAQCQDCSKGLCNECAKQFSLPICSTCNTARGGNEKNRIMKELFLTFGIGIGLVYMASKGPIGELLFKENSIQSTLLILGMAYVYSGLVAGWYTLNKITPQIFLFLPLIGWVIYFVVKAMIAMWVGLVMLPVRTYRNITRLKEISAITN